MAKLVSLELDDEDKHDGIAVSGKKPDYPYGLRICLCDAELDKLGLDADCDVGDYLDLRCFATVTNVTKGENGRRVEMQIEKMSAENENDE